MIKLLLFILLVLGLAYGFAVLADMPGDVVVTVAGQEISFTLMVAAVALVAAIVAVMVTWWLIRVIFTSPQRVTRMFRSRRRDRGYQALSTGIIAAGAGDPATARKMLKRADGLLVSTSEPLVQLLEAQAVMLEGDHDGARTKFEKMLEDPELRDLGLRGLYMEAQRLGDRDAQKHYAEKAAELAPQLAWASKAALDLKTSSGDWEGALRLVEQQVSAKHIDRDAAKRKRAVLLTAIAMENTEPNPTRAKQAGLEAHRLAPEFAPSAVAASDACLRLNEMRRAAKVLETSWRKAPHPDVALAYVNVRAGDSAQDRLRKARKLEQLKPNNPDSSMIVAQMAMEAGEYDAARSAVAAVLRNDPRESAYLLMADIEENETGDQGKIREWLARALRAPRDPAWTADGYVAEKWAPFSPISGRIDAFEWKVPVERIGGNLIEDDADPMQRGTAAISMIEPVSGDRAVAAEGPAKEPEPDLVAAEDAVRETPKETKTEAPPSPEAPVVEATHQDETDTSEPASPPDAKPVTEEASDSVKDDDTEEATSDPKLETKSTEKTDEDAPPDRSETVTLTDTETKKDSGSPAPAKEEEDALVAPIPDDPGVDPDAEPVEEPKRFRLF
ncbi:MAG: heme biosynthesis HemY N-terminal domain-containing protein [Pseudomonadota bacterium]